MTIAVITVLSMAAILKNGRHLEFSFGQMVFSKEQHLRSVCANFGAFIRKCMIIAVISPAKTLHLSKVPFESSQFKKGEKIISSLSFCL